MKYLAIAAIGLALFVLSGDAAVEGQGPYTIRDAIAGNQNIKFGWTQNGGNFKPQTQFFFKCGNAMRFTRGINAPNIPFDWRNDRPDLVGQACQFIFVAPALATDWKQTIIGPNGKSTVYAGNIKRESPWVFEDLVFLSDVPTRIPDLAPAAGKNPDLTIYAAVNLEEYMRENPLGFLDGSWTVGQTLSEVGVEIIGGVASGASGMYWATTPFEFDPDPLGVGFVPVGGNGTLLDSAAFETGIEILQQHVGGGGVGGFAALPDVDAAPLEGLDSSGAGPGVWAAIIGAAAVAGSVLLGGAAWYARRRRGA